MTQPRTCSVCRFWGGRDWPDTYDRAHCQRHAPIAANRRENFQSEPVWPSTRDVDWCGDFEFYERAPSADGAAPKE